MPWATSPQPDSPAARPLLSARDLSKRFGQTLAIDDVSLDLFPGEIHGVLGENGAGKSTLFAVLAGMERPDGGKVQLDGRTVRLNGPGGALRLGITSVYQQAALAPTLSIAENVALGCDGVGSGLLEAETRVAPYLRALGVQHSPRTVVADLSPGDRQRVEIARALARNSRLLLLDEPTALLAPTEIGHLLDTLRHLRSCGVAIALVTHKLEEILGVADRLTILRSGRVAGVLDPMDVASGNPDALRAKLVSLMFGDDLRPREPSPRSRRGAVVLSLRHLHVHDDRRFQALRDFSLDLHAGEIVGIAGVEGNGQQELTEVVGGQRLAAVGEVLLHGRDLAGRGVRAAVRAGVSYLTDDRFGEGCVRVASVADNVALKRVGNAPFSDGIRLNRQAMATAAERVIDWFRVWPRHPLVPIETLSGGNVQKVLLGRELAIEPAVLVCKEPTQGLDARTTELVRVALRRRAESGGTILLVSTDLDELLELSDRVGVLFRGRLAGPFPRDRVNRGEIGRLMVAGVRDGDRW